MTTITFTSRHKSSATLTVTFFFDQSLIRHNFLTCLWININKSTSLVHFCRKLDFCLIIVRQQSTTAVPRCLHPLLLNLSQKKDPKPPGPNLNGKLLTMRSIMTMATLSEMSSSVLPMALQFHLLLRLAYQVLDQQDW